MVRHLLFIGALMGAAGVALSAAAAHADAARNLQNVAFMLIMHGTLVVSLALRGDAGGVLLRLGALTLIGGTLLFAADLVMLAFQGHRLFAYAAPIGGSAMIGGWVFIALAALKRHHG